MPSSIDSEEVAQTDVEKVDYIPGESEAQVDKDAEFGGTEARKRLERKLLWKIDLRMSILILIYILNYVSCLPRFTERQNTD